jgi:phosphoserine phosphatase RsbU/P
MSAARRQTAGSPLNLTTNRFLSLGGVRLSPSYAVADPNDYPNILPVLVDRTFSTPMSTKLLLVDDDEIVLDYLKLLVAAEGYDVVTATNGKAALVAMHQNLAQIVILDVNMPDMNGLAVCRGIRQQKLSACVYLMLHSSNDTDQDILEGLDAGADDYLTKGMSKVQFLGRLRTAQRILSLEGRLKSSLERAERA